MRIVQINSVYNRGSTGRIAYNIHENAIARGHEILTFYGRYQDIKGPLVKKIGGKFSVFLHMCLSTIGLNGYGSNIATLKLIKNIMKFNPDIIQLHNLHGYYINFSLFIKWIKSYNIPIVWTLHDCWSFTGHCAYYSYLECCRWKIQCRKCPQKNNYPYSFFFDNSYNAYILKRKLLTKFDNLNIITPSIWLSNQVKMSFLRESPLWVIPNGINLTNFRYIEQNHSEKYTILGIANPWTSRKGLDFFFELSNYLKEDEQIVLVGLNKRQIKLLPAKIIGISSTNSLEELTDFYNKADVFVNPTLEDNFPTTNLESLACGTPIVTFNTGGSPEVVNKLTGIVTDDKSAQSLYKAIQEIRSNGKRYYSNSCIQKSKEYDMNIVYNKYIDLYESLIQKQSE